MSAIESELRDILKGYVLRDQAAQAKIADLQIQLQAYATLTDAQDRQIKAWRPVVEAAINFDPRDDALYLAVRAIPPEARP